MFCIKCFHKNFIKIAGKDLFFLFQWFSFEFCEIFKNTYFYRTPLVAAFHFFPLVKRFVKTHLCLTNEHWRLIILKNTSTLFKLPFQKSASTFFKLRSQKSIQVIVSLILAVGKFHICQVFWIFTSSYTVFLGTTVKRER